MTDRNIDGTIKFIPLKYESEKGDASALRILQAFDQDWNSGPGSISIKRFAEGNMNTVGLSPSSPFDI